MKRLKVFQCVFNFSIYLLISSLPYNFNILYAAVLLPEDMPPPSYTPSKSTCIVVEHYQGSKIETGRCWIYKVNTGWVFQHCEIEPVCFTSSNSGLGEVFEDRSQEETDGQSKGKVDIDIEIEVEVVKKPNPLWQELALIERANVDLEHYMLQAVPWLQKWNKALPSNDEDIEKWLSEGRQVFTHLDEIINAHVGRLSQHLGSSGAPDSHLRLRAMHDGWNEAFIEMFGRLFRIYAHGLSSKINRDVKKKITAVFFDEALSSEERIKKIKFLVKEVESRIRNMPRQSGILPHIQPSSKVEGWIDESLDEELIQLMAQRGEMDVYRTALDFMKEHTIRKEEQSLSQEFNLFQQEVNQHFEDINQLSIRSIDYDSADELYDKAVSEPVDRVLLSQYNRNELKVLHKPSLTQPEEEPYEFISPEGEFLEKNKAVYEKLREANPYHEQGVLARDVGLSAVEVADEEFAEGNKPEAETAFHVAEAMSDIALGIMPYVGTGKDFYELLTGKHLLTGRNLTLFERSMSVVGIALAGVSGGVVNSGQVRTALNVTHRAVGKINKKLQDKFLRGLSGTQLARTIKEYPNAFFKSMEEAGLSSKEKVISSAKFVGRAFSKENPRIEELSRVIRVVGKEGIEAYVRALSEISHQLKKSDSLELPELGKVFLARQLRFKDKIFDQTKKIVNEESLVQMGKTYARTSEELPKGSSLDKILPNFVRSDGNIEIFRTLRTTFPYNHTEKTAFLFHGGMKSSIVRYTVGENALYTSLTKETSHAEFLSRFLRGAPENKTFSKLIDPSEIDKVLDLTDPKVLKQLGINTKSIIKDIDEYLDAYDTTQVIGHIAKNRGFKGIVAPSALDDLDDGINFISFLEFK